MSQRILLFAVILIGLLLASSALGQGATGTLKGQIIDATGQAVQGMSVTVSDTGTGLSRTVTTNEDGRFQLQLVPGHYTLRSSGTGYSSVTIDSVDVNVGGVHELRIPVMDAVMEEIIAYGTAAPLMKKATGETSIYISLDDLEKLPVSRSIEAVALLAPGTVPGIDAFGDDKTLVSFGGSSVAENTYYIDGLNVSNFRTGLGGSSVPFEFYDQFQIKTGGYSAEFGRSTGGVLNAVTRRGGNEFEYGVVAYIEPEAGQGNSPDTKRPDGTYYDFNSKNSESSTTTDIYVSGPIIRDRLFFFVLYEPQRSSREDNERGSPDRRWVEEIDEDFWGGNLTWNITDYQSLSYTAFSDEREIKADLFSYDIDNQERGDKIGDSTGFRGGDSFVLSYDAQFTDSFLLSAKYGRNKYDLTDRSSADDGCPLIVDVSDSSTSTFPGCWVNAFVGTANDEREAYRLDVEYYLGDHTIRAGFDREDNVSFDADTYSGLSFTPDLTGGAYYRYESWDVGTPLPGGGIVPDVNGDGSRVDTVRFRYYEGGGTFDTISSAWYLEDTWGINDAFTISLGIRNETFENFNGIGDTFFKIDDQWAPRLALSWSPDGRQDQRLTLNWGRYHLPIMARPNIAFGRAYLDYRSYYIYDGNRDATTQAPVAIDGNGIPTTQQIGTTLIQGDGSVPDVRGSLDTSLKPMYQDEWIVAYEREFGDEWSAGIRYVRRELQSLIEDVTPHVGLEAINFPNVGFTQGCGPYVMTNPGTDMTTFCDSDGDGTLEETFIPADALGYPKARRTYEAIDLTAEKVFGDNWALQGSYTLSWNKGNTEGTVKSDNGQSDANATEDFDHPHLMDGAYGYLPNDRRHKLRLWASYQATDRLSLGINVFAQSGRPINAFGNSHPDGAPPYGSTFYLITDVGDPAVEGDESFEFVPRGTRGRTDWMSQVDLAAIYAFAWGDTADIELRAEVFNVFGSDSAMSVYEWIEDRPDQYKLPRTYQQPRYLRFGLAMRF